MSDQAAKSQTTLTREESAFFIKTVWEGLISPTWSKDHIIEFGKAVFAQTKLSQLTDQQMTMLLPYLKQIANTIGTKILQQAQSAAPSSPAPSAQEPSAEPNHG
jgi:hypothetical protein